ncbi:MAG TPA: tRNA lysidine(34) synthetase TilS [Gammaproteobacteria bacterium]|nr:tRNA lysidine(34) synthetase TilS [Gammaproteobacteria bacterium]
MAFTPDRLRTRLSALPAIRHYLVGFSGGLDSSVLLHAMVSLKAAASWSVEAIHVHHGLQPQADIWSTHCRCVCERLMVPFKLVCIDAKAATGESPEAAARSARYRVFKDSVKADACLLTAHQQDDQAETLLLQLLRGAGPAGLSAMPAITAFGAGWHARLLLDFTRAELADYAAAYGLSWVEDASNRDTALDRNFVRHKILTSLRARWPACARTLSRAAELQAEAVELLGELARQELRTVAGNRADTLSVARLRSLSRARQCNVLRYWLLERGLPVPVRRQIEHILSDAIGARWDSTPAITWPGAEVRRYRDDLFAMAPLPRHDPHRVLRWDPRGPLSIPHLGIVLEPPMIARAGVSEVDKVDITVRFRRGGERCRPVGHSHHRELKKLFQEAGIPPWERDRIPLIYVGERLVIVAGYWTCN